MRCSRRRKAGVTKQGKPAAARRYFVCNLTLTIHSEIIWNNLNPDFVKKFVMQYYFEQSQKLKFEVLFHYETFSVVVEMTKQRFRHAWPRRCWEEIPDQFLSYMQRHNIKPKPPLQRQGTISSVHSLPVTEHVSLAKLEMQGGISNADSTCHTR
nr:hypothetical protein BaRGS_024233 [Batillaria attramentaria]